MNPNLSIFNSVILGIMVACGSEVSAQSSASATLDPNNVSALVRVAGDHFRDLESNSKFEVPKGSGNHSIFASALWIGGIKSDQLHMSAMTYRQIGEDFWAGPLDEFGRTDKSIAQAWDKMWVITKAEIEKFLKYPASMSDAIRYWPAKGNNGITRDLAPFVDANNNGKYEPEKGDYPCMKGDQMVWWIFNDQREHSETRGMPLGVEVHAMAYSFNYPTDQAVHNTVFFEYDVINRTYMTYDSVYAAIWTDFDLGEERDDYIGCDTNLNISYVYNADNMDWQGGRGYGENPPVQAMAFLNRKLEYFIPYQNDFSVTGNPTEPAHFYYYMTGRYKDGSPITFNGAKNNWWFPSHPGDINGWSEVTVENKPGDRRTVSAIKIGSLKPGKAGHIAFAYVFSRESSKDHIGNVSVMKRNVADIKTIYDNVLAGSCPSALTIADELVKDPYMAIFPNPFVDAFKIVLPKTGSEVVEVYDVLGRQKLISNFDHSSSIQLNTADWLPGVYLVKISYKGRILTKRIEKI